MNPNYQGPFGNTLLHVAAAYGDEGEVQRLLAAGADPRIRNREGRTPLQVAVMLERSDLVPLLGRPSDAHVEQLLDEALKQTFPASDPIAVSSAASRPPRTPR